jgi:hypothetical protein
MKPKKMVTLLIFMGSLASCIAAYLFFPQVQAIRWMITSIVEVPACTARIAEELEIQPDPTSVKSYILNSLRIGMTPNEVEQAIRDIAPIEVGKTYIDQEHKTHTQILIKLCNNPIGNILLFVSYSNDGHLLNVVDAHED